MKPKCKNTDNLFVVVDYFLRFLSRYIGEFLFFSLLFFLSTLAFDSEGIEALFLDHVLELFNSLSVLLLSFDVSFLPSEEVFFKPLGIVSFLQNLLPFLSVILLSICTYIFGLVNFNHLYVNRLANAYELPLPVKLSFSITVGSFCCLRLMLLSIFKFFLGISRSSSGVALYTSSIHSSSSWSFVNPLFPMTSKPCNYS